MADTVAETYASPICYRARAHARAAATFTYSQRNNHKPQATPSLAYGLDSDLIRLGELSPKLAGLSGHEVLACNDNLHNLSPLPRQIGDSVEQHTLDNQPDTNQCDTVHER